MRRGCPSRAAWHLEKIDWATLLPGCTLTIDSVDWRPRLNFASDALLDYVGQALRRRHSRSSRGSGPGPISSRGPMRVALQVRIIYAELDDLKYTSAGVHKDGEPSLVHATHVADH